MGDHFSHQHPAHQPDPLAPLRGQFPAWEAWRGVTGGLLYARRRRSSPAVVFRDVTGEGLARQIREFEARQH
jgi:hypothetical protein